MKHVFSTLTADNRYADWEKGPGLNTFRKAVLVRGGAGVALPGGGQQVITPLGVRTEVSEEDADFLKAHPLFQQHQARGFVRIENAARDPDKVGEKMEDDEGSAPKSPADVQKAAEDAAKKSGLKPGETLSSTTNKKG